MFEYKSNNQKFCEECKKEERHYKPVKVEHTDRERDNNDSELDIYEKGQVINLEGHNWTINTVYEDNAKRYDCITKMGNTVQHRMYYALDLRQGKLLGGI